MAFVLDPRLAANTLVAELPLCSVFLAEDAAYPWLILVPRVAEVAEITDLSDADQLQLLAEISRCSHALKAVKNPHKMNVAALGNIVRQLHVHVVARYEGDAAWPGPIWGAHPATPYVDADRQALVLALQTHLK